MKEAYPEEDLTLFVGIILGNNFESFEKENNMGNIPAIFYLSNAFPNPFNPSTQIKFSILEDEFVTLKCMTFLKEKLLNF